MSLQNVRSPVPSRETLLGHRGAVLWFTGLSASGKSTLAVALEQQLLREHVLTAVIDGDALRVGLSQDLGFSPNDRSENIRRAAELAFAMAAAGVVVIVALISPFRSDRERVARRAREKGLPFAEVFINASLSACEARDPKGLYRNARAGKLSAFTGIDSPYEPPLAPDLEIRTDTQSVARSVEQLARAALELCAATERQLKEAI